jgi:uncharacterized protein with HEPN domain
VKTEENAIVPHRALLGLIETAATEILTLTGEMEQHDFFDSRLTRAETVKRLRRVAEAAETLPPALREAIPEIDWAQWSALAREFATAGAAQAALWRAIRELTPMTLQWLRVYRDARPELFLPAS